MLHPVQSLGQQHQQRLVMMQKCKSQGPTKSTESETPGLGINSLACHKVQASGNSDAAPVWEPLLNTPNNLAKHIEHHWLFFRYYFCISSAVQPQSDPFATMSSSRVMSSLFSFTCSQTWLVKVEVLPAQLRLPLCDPTGCSPPAPLSMEFSRQEYWSGQPHPSPGAPPNPGIKPMSPAMQANSLPQSHQGSPCSNQAAPN